jgi:alpha/beta superfamily hydrolase
VSGAWTTIEGPAGTLRVYASTRGPAVPVLLVSPELPVVEGGTGDVGPGYETLADRLAQESGWRVVSPMPRGIGGSQGDFSASGWLADLSSVLDHDLAPDGGAWLAGFGFGGAVALRLAAADQRVRGVACLGTPADLSGWAADPVLFAERCRRAGVIGAGFPKDPTAWANELSELRPVDAVSALAPRPLLVVQGDDDAVLTTAAAHTLVDAATGRCELRMVPGAGHGLRADPRAVATLVGWLERQR